MSPAEQDVNAQPSGATTEPRRHVVDVVGLKVGPGPLDPRLVAEFTYRIIGTEPGPLARAAPKASDKRGKERTRTRLRAGQLSDRRDTVIVDCLIQDRSATGARLLLAEDRPLPKTFLLLDAVTQTRFSADLAWRRGREAGVRLKAV